MFSEAWLKSIIVGQTPVFTPNHPRALQATVRMVGHDGEYGWTVEAEATPEETMELEAWARRVLTRAAGSKG